MDEMITREQAKNIRLRCPDDKQRWIKFVNELYDSRGTCGECSHSTKGQDDRYICPFIFSWNVPLPADWFCADFERKEG